MNNNTEVKMLEELREHLRIAKSWNWEFNKMCYIDGFLKALNLATGKDYGYSGTDIYVTNENNERIRI